MENVINFKLIVLGAQGVGKSSLITRYVRGEFNENYHVTVGVEFATKAVRTQDAEVARLQIWDTAGQEFFRSLVRSFYKGIAAVFLVFALDNLDSFRELETWVSQLRENAHEEVVLFLIGARADFETKREVGAEQAAAFLRRIQGALYVETSAKTGQNIELLFERAAGILSKKYRANKSFAQLVQPDDQQSSFMAESRSTRGKSLVLRKQTLPEGNRGSTRKTCCN